MASLMRIFFFFAPFPKGSCKLIKTQTICLGFVLFLGFAYSSGEDLPTWFFLVNDDAPHLACRRTSPLSSWWCASSYMSWHPVVWRPVCILSPNTQFSLSLHGNDQWFSFDQANQSSKECSQGVWAPVKWLRRIQYNLIHLHPNLFLKLTFT